LARLTSSGSGRSVVPLGDVGSGILAFGGDGRGGGGEVSLDAELARDTPPVAPWPVSKV